MMEPGLLSGSHSTDGINFTPQQKSGLQGFRKRFKSMVLFNCVCIRRRHACLFMQLCVRMLEAPSLGLDPLPAAVIIPHPIQTNTHPHPTLAMDAFFLVPFGVFQMRWPILYLTVTLLMNERPHSPNEHLSFYSRDSLTSTDHVLSVEIEPMKISPFSLGITGVMPGRLIPKSYNTTSSCHLCHLEVPFYQGHTHREPGRGLLLPEVNPYPHPFLRQGLTM